MENNIKILINIHATLGAIALLTGFVAILAKKGRIIHKQSGKIFYISMLSSAILAFIISVLPNHQSPFLFSIGIFSIYFLIGGVRSLKFKDEYHHFKTDKIIAYIMILTAIAMITYPIILNSCINIILTVFGIIGLVFAIRDLMLFRNRKRIKTGWLKLHLGKMLGGYIASVTAFFVTSNILSGIYNWFVPGIFGSIYITYWMIKLDQPKKVNE